MSNFYLMLDKDDITNVCGTITPKEVIKELNMRSYQQFYNFVSYSKVFRDKYILIEDEKPKIELPKAILIYENELGRKYYGTHDGKFYVVYKHGKVKFLKTYLKNKRNHLFSFIKISNKEYVAKNLIADLYIDEYKKGDVVLLKNNDPQDVSVENLIVVDKAKYARMTGAMSKSKRVGLYEDNKLIKKYRSAREAGRKLYCSYQTIIDICNKKTKKKLVDVRWI